MVIIGSQALQNYFDIPIRIKMLDIDYICSEDELESIKKSITPGYVQEHTVKDNKIILSLQTGFHEEYEIARPGTSGALVMDWCNSNPDKLVSNDMGLCVPLNVLYMLKMSHRFRKNSPHFLKTMKDIHLMRSKGAEITKDLKDIYKLRMKETYSYSHPKLNVGSKDFFSNDGVPYVYEHDDIHRAIALLDKPAFTYYMQEGAEVFTSKDKFFSVEEHIRLLGVYEETCVLALERSQIPNNFSIDPEVSFMISLMKVCTSITSGWFREYAWETYFKVVELYYKLGKNDYVNRFKEKEHTCSLYKGGK